jgi:hypothetical protein
MGARLARRAARRLLQKLRYQKLEWDGLPVLFANSFPKSGTHLLTQILHGFTRLGPAVESGLPAIVTYQGESGRQREAGEICRDLRRLLPGDIAYGHLHATPETVELLCGPGFATYLMLRDPRDVVVSHVHYVTEMEPNHALHRYYTQELGSFEERLRTSLLGLPEAEIPFPDIRLRLEPYLGWLERTEIACLQYEAFGADPQQFLQRVLEHATQRGFPCRLPSEQALQALRAGIDPQRSPTFRQGGSGGWRERFSPENKRLFKDVTGDLLVRLGYEANQDW